MISDETKNNLGEVAHKGVGHRKRLRDRFLQSGLDGFLDYEIVELLLTLGTPRRDCFERETEIIDPKEFKEALLLMGYKPVVEIHKVRRKAKYKDYEICLDDVKELGTFVEVEKITDNENADKVQYELFSFLESLGVSKDNREMHGYDTLVYLKRAGT